MTNFLIHNNHLVLGLEVIVQVTVTILLLLLNRTETATTGGLETIFDEGRDATTFLAVSITWSIISAIKLA